MRFFTSITPAGKGEYFAVALVLNIALLYVAFVVFKLEPNFDTLRFGYAVDKIPHMAFTYAGYAGLIIINSMRRMKKLRTSDVFAFVAALPVIGVIVQLMLAATEDDNKSAYTPYGSDPYDPNSWVPKATSSGKDRPRSVSAVRRWCFRVKTATTKRPNSNSICC